MLARVLSWLALLARSDATKDAEIPTWCYRYIQGEQHSGTALWCRATQNTKNDTNNASSTAATRTILQDTICH
jgi:hypothetical protein